MSQLPPPMDPLPYATPPMWVPPRRPTSVTVIAILAIIFGSIGVLGDLCAIPQNLGAQFWPDPLGSATSKDAVLVTFNLIGAAVTLILSIPLIIGGIASLSLKPLGRTMMLLYAILQIVETVLWIPFQVLLISPRVDRILKTKMVATPSIMTGIKIGSVIGPAFSLLSLVWPALILYFMTRQRVKTAFEEGM